MTCADKSMDTQGAAFADSILSSSFVLINDGTPTHVKGGCIDLTMVSSLLATDTSL